MPTHYTQPHTHTAGQHSAHTLCTQLSLSTDTLPALLITYLRTCHIHTFLKRFICRTDTLVACLYKKRQKTLATHTCTLVPTVTHNTENALLPLPPFFLFICLPVCLSGYPSVYLSSAHAHNPSGASLHAATHTPTRPPPPPPPPPSLPHAALLTKWLSTSTRLSTPDRYVEIQETSF